MAGCDCGDGEEAGRLAPARFSKPAGEQLPNGFARWLSSRKHQRASACRCRAHFAAQGASERRRRQTGRRRWPKLAVSTLNAGRLRRYWPGLRARAQGTKWRRSSRRSRFPTLPKATSTPLSNGRCTLRNANSSTTRHAHPRKRLPTVASTGRRPSSTKPLGPPYRHALPTEWAAAADWLADNDTRQHAAALLLRLKQSGDTSLAAAAGRMIEEIKSIEPAAGQRLIQPAFFGDPGFAEPPHIQDLLPRADTASFEVLSRPLPRMVSDSEPIAAIGFGCEPRGERAARPTASAISAADRGRPSMGRAAGAESAGCCIRQG